MSLIASGQLRVSQWGFELRECLIGTTLLGFFNAEYIRLSREVQNNGLLASVFFAFGISAIVWVSLFAVIKLLSGLERETLSQREALVLFLTIALCILPVTALSGFALTFMGCYFSIFGKTDRVRRAMRIQLALTAALLWGRVSFSFLMPYVLPLDAALVSLLADLKHDGNIIISADNTTTLQVGAGCSSFLNLTLAMLGWATTIIYFRAPVTVRSLFLLLSSCIAILIVNSVRIGLIGWFPSWYELIHGDIGSNIVNVIDSACVCLFSWAAVRSREPGFPSMGQAQAPERGPRL